MSPTNSLPALSASTIDGTREWGSVYASGQGRADPPYPVTEAGDLTGRDLRDAFAWAKHADPSAVGFALVYLKGETSVDLPLSGRLSFAATVATERHPVRRDPLYQGMLAVHRVALLIHHRLDHEAVLALTPEQHRTVGYPTLVAAAAAGCSAAEIGMGLGYQQAATLAALRGFRVPPEASPGRVRAWLTRQLGN